ncbi:hypothetical protein AGMMS49992_02120 [Clostridia bacterium]|nr:hypothetical protein AGMMS49992_02120 [Clostridia bacterium]
MRFSKGMAIGLALVMMLMTSAALASTTGTTGIFSYDVPAGFTATENFDEQTKVFQLTLVSDDGTLTLGFLAAQYPQFEGLDLTAADDDDLPGILAVMEIDADALGLTVELVSDMDEETGEVYAYIALYDDNDSENHMINIDVEGWIEYEAMARTNGPLTDADYDLFFEFYNSIIINE